MAALVSSQAEVPMHSIPFDEKRTNDPRTPIMLMVDDPAPIVHVYRCHHPPFMTDDGRPLLEEVPTDFVERFAEVVERWGMRGKFSIVPGMGGRGNLTGGIDGERVDEIRRWLDLVRERLAQHMDFCPEMITHNLAVDLASGKFLGVNEAVWAETQTERTLAPYITRALEMLRDAGINATGVTSPWDFGIKEEAHYQRAIVAAQRAVYGRERSWYFLHMMDRHPESRPWLAVNEPPTVLVSIPSTVNDWCWQTIHSAETGPTYLCRVADEFLTQDGRSGQIATVVAAGGWPILVTHWQSVFSNGLETGLAALDEVGRRVSEQLSDRVVWCSATEVMERTIRSCERLGG
jgi:hypothetical protein